MSIYLSVDLCLQYEYISLQPTVRSKAITISILPSMFNISRISQFIQTTVIWVPHRIRLTKKRLQRRGQYFKKRERGDQRRKKEDAKERGVYRSC